MDVDAVTLFFALLAVLAQAGVVAGLIVLVLGGERREQVREAVGDQALGLALAVALVATLGSLYLSEVAGFPPCRWCLVQRAFMYPQVLVLGYAALRRDWRAAPVAAGLSAFGLPVSVYHSLLERFPQLETGVCDPVNPCSLIWVEHFGLYTIPVMAGTGFAAILMALAVGRPRRTDARSGAGAGKMDG